MIKHIPHRTTIGSLRCGSKAKPTFIVTQSISKLVLTIVVSFIYDQQFPRRRIPAQQCLDSTDLDTSGRIRLELSSDAAALDPGGLYGADGLVAQLLAVGHPDYRSAVAASDDIGSKGGLAAARGKHYKRSIGARRIGLSHFGDDLLLIRAQRQGIGTLP